MSNDKASALDQDKKEGDQPFIPAAESIVKMLAEEWREDVEQKPLSVNVGLAKGLKNMPADWLDGMCIEWGIEPAPQARLGERNHRIAAIPVELRERLSHLLQKHQ